MSEDVDALSKILGILRNLEPEAQARVLQSIHIFLGASMPTQISANLDPSNSSTSDFTKDRSLSPKEFMRDKAPKTDVERVTCLAYYLANYRDTPHFKTLDISNLNTEAAQPKFSNPSVALDNATRTGYLVPATKGNKQITSAGEKFVELLPDREAARAALRTARRKKTSPRSKQRIAKGS